MSRMMIISAAVAVIGLGAYFVTSPGTNPVTPANPLGAANAQEAADIDTSSIMDMTLGNPDAPVTVIEYASYTCPHCARFHEGPFKQLKADYIDTGKINFVYREVYFDRYGLWASMIARCAGTPESFFGMSDLIYQKQSEWSRAGDPAAIVDELRKVGLLAGLDRDTMEACLQNGEKAQTLVAWYQENATADGIESTPSFLINGQRYSNMSYAEMAELIDAAAE
ncbi:DsbA family protein [Roseobacter denitrificans]|uniref:Thiol-disulfide oxidoreductase D, Putative n=1 Tax=Roseobacter denitrificans (strain ATCC 33942 / OCh 114) TaxID=375451 RepID=Q16DC3_ROSDO|nr:DsbA family protein [Roseobacter denitrificans]ABG30020.1 thiol-disulfide oxidoreductase D, Putative [Roseobacter denitrificans OCh 114]AVL53223.1 DsbA family protein [Roseobacter denitrificans]SFF68796.1 Protein-disulfide isomerase [Roseobacter denitrificans OCh 114]